MSATFDTLRLARTLRDKAHFSSEQAEGMAEAMQSDLATKSDVSSVQTVLKSEMREMELRLEARIEATKPI